MKRKKKLGRLEKKKSVKSVKSDSVVRKEIVETVLNNIIDTIENEEKKSVSLQKLRYVLHNAEHSPDEPRDPDVGEEGSSTDSETESDGDSSGEEDDGIGNSFVIADINVIQESLQCIACCRECGSDIEFREVSRIGLGTRLEFSCRNSACVVSPEQFDATPKSTRRYDINSQLLLGARFCGMGRSGINKLFTVMNMQKPISRPAWRKLNCIMEDFSVDLREESCRQARLEAASVAADDDPENVNKDGSVNIATGVDGTWQKRGWDSPVGVVAAVAQDTSKVVNVHVMVNSCAQCTSIKSLREKGKIYPDKYDKKVRF